MKVFMFLRKVYMFLIPTCSLSFPERTETWEIVRFGNVVVFEAHEKPGKRAFREVRKGNAKRAAREEPPLRGIIDGSMGLMISSRR